jgi:hypothetical protein
VSVTIDKAQTDPRHNPQLDAVCRARRARRARRAAAPPRAEARRAAPQGLGLTTQTLLCVAVRRPNPKPPSL